MIGFFIDFLIGFIWESIKKVLLEKEEAVAQERPTDIGEPTSSAPEEIRKRVQRNKTLL